MPKHGTKAKPHGNLPKPKPKPRPAPNVKSKPKHKRWLT